MHESLFLSFFHFLLQSTYMVLIIDCKHVKTRRKLFSTYTSVLNHGSKFSESWITRSSLLENCITTIPTCVTLLILLIEMYIWHYIVSTFMYTHTHTIVEIHNIIQCTNSDYRLWFLNMNSLNMLQSFCVYSVCTNY